MNKTISLTPFVFEKIKEEFNASQLIDRLLREYWEKHGKTEKVEEEVFTEWKLD